MRHIATGTIEDAWNSDASVKVRTDEQFEATDVSRLLLFFDMTEMCRANTDQNVVMGISREHRARRSSSSPNAGSTITNSRLTFPGNVIDFRHVPGVLDIRNDLATLGTQKSKAIEIVKT